MRFESLTNAVDEGLVRDRRLRRSFRPLRCLGTFLLGLRRTRCAPCRGDEARPHVRRLRVLQGGEGCARPGRCAGARGSRLEKDFLRCRILHRPARTCLDGRGGDLFDLRDRRRVKLAHGSFEANGRSGVGRGFGGRRRFRRLGRGRRLHPGGHRRRQAVKQRLEGVVHRLEGLLGLFVRTVWSALSSVKPCFRASKSACGPACGR